MSRAYLGRGRCKKRPRPNRIGLPVPFRCQGVVLPLWPDTAKANIMFNDS